jgi:hypothetical protein
MNTASNACTVIAVMSSRAMREVHLATQCSGKHHAHNSAACKAVHQLYSSYKGAYTVCFVVVYTYRYRQAYPPLRAPLQGAQQGVVATASSNYNGY